ncbi:MAG TPA: hypothetical protein VNO55_29250 [Polyangia bacterium]|nr:hypothetical protein [Polyangia bacterium]
MTNMSGKDSLLAATTMAVLCAAIGVGCSRSVTVDGNSGGGFGETGGAVGSGGDSPARSGGAGGEGGGNVVGSGGKSGAGGAGPTNGGGGSTVGAGGGHDGGSPDTVLTGNPLIDEINQNNPAAAAMISQPEMLATLTDIQLPSVGSDGVSILQYAAGGSSAVVLHADWADHSGLWYGTSAARYAYTAASGTHHLNLLYLATTYDIYDDGNLTELSGTPMTYKEFLTANANGYAWVDYENKSRAPGATNLGKIVFQTWAGARTALTDALRYRSRPDLSADHVAFVEYASTAPGTIGQIVAQPVSGAAAVTAAPSAHHQDRPAIDGPWVVWEEYLSTTDAVIRARNLSTSEVRSLSASTGFRTNADIQGTRVIWEDQRSGNGDIYLTDLATSTGEVAVITGSGHSSGARLTPDGLVWTESAGGKVALLRARWAR